VTALSDYAAARGSVLECQHEATEAGVTGDLLMSVAEGELDVETDAAASRAVDAAEDLAAAHETLRAAEDKLPEGVLQAAWDANQQAVTAAKQAVGDRLADYRQTEQRCHDKARRRNPAHPVLNAAELAECQTAYAAFTEAKAAVAEAIEQFKAGVTAEQLEPVIGG